MATQPIRIAVDAMGGDHAPAEIARGALAAVRRQSVHVILVGDREAVRTALRDTTGRVGLPAGIDVVHASEHIGMDELPLAAIRQKRDASISVAARLVRDGEAEGLAAAGHTGAVLAASLMNLGRIPGIDRPAVALVLPTITGGRVVMLDAGANVDSRPQHLLQFAQMGRLYAHVHLQVPEPKVGLMSIGEEDIKGNDLTRAAFRLLSEADLHFVGNVQGSDVTRGQVDVIVCDGFVGNVLIKGAEGCATFFIHSLRQALGDGWLARLGALLLTRNLKRLQAKLDWAEYGGALLLGVNGVVVVTHGASTSKAICNCIGVARQLAQGRIVEQVRAMLNGQSSAPTYVGGAAVGSVSAGGSIPADPSDEVN